MGKLNKFYIKEKRYIKRGEIIPYGVKMVGAPFVWGETMGEGIKVGVIDTGVDIAHIDLKDRIIKYKNFTNEDYNDYNGHGTHICGIIGASKNNIGLVGVAPRCSMLVAKAFLKDGTCEEKNIINSIRWLTEERVDVINMSFSAQNFTPEYHSVIREADKNGIVMVAAAGNEAKQGIGYPARFKEIICVGAVDYNRKKAYFSSMGERVDVAAAGSEILSCYPQGKYAVLSGTSMATPVITGAVALIKAKAKKRLRRNLTPDEVKLILKINSHDLGIPGKDENYGYGLFTF